MLRFVQLGTPRQQVTDARLIRKAADEMVFDFLLNKMLLAVQMLNPANNARLVAKFCRQFLKRVGGVDEPGRTTFPQSALALVESMDAAQPSASHRQRPTPIVVIAGPSQTEVDVEQTPDVSRTRGQTLDTPAASDTAATSPRFKFPDCAAEPGNADALVKAG